MYKNKVLKKGFIFAIILLFVGLNFTSSINSYTIKTGIQSNVKSYKNLPLNHDYNVFKLLEEKRFKTISVFKPNYVCCWTRNVKALQTLIE